MVHLFLGRLDGGEAEGDSGTAQEGEWNEEKQTGTTFGAQV